MLPSVSLKPKRPQGHLVCVSGLTAPTRKLANILLGAVRSKFDLIAASGC